VIQYLSLAYEAYHCSAMLHCSPVSVSLCLHLLAIYDLLFFSTRAPHPSFSVSLSCCTHALRFLCFFLFYSVHHVHSMNHSSSLYFRCCTLLLHTPESPSTIATTHLFFVQHTYSLFAPCACYLPMLSPCRVLCMIIIATLQLLWQLNPCVHHHWVLCQDNFTSPAVKTLRILFYSRAQPLCCSYRLQHSSICQSPL
jgi:hypothetical protein